jgi:hypothetical protein
LRDFFFVVFTLLDLIVADGSALVTSADTCEPDPSVWERDIRCLREKWGWKYMKVDTGFMNPAALMLELEI